MLAAIGVGTLAAVVAIAVTLSSAVVGVVFRGAAVAWKEERDAAVDKAERLERRVGEQDKQIEELRAKLALLEERTNYETYAHRSAAEHKAILDALERVAAKLEALDGAVRGNTAATELVAKGSLVRDALDDERRNA